MEKGSIIQSLTACLINYQYENELINNWFKLLQPIMRDS
jgi:hypothetical protein